MTTSSQQSTANVGEDSVIAIIPTTREPELFGEQGNFHLVQMASGKQKSRCKNCGKILSAASNSNMREHIKSHCKALHGVGTVDESGTFMAHDGGGVWNFNLAAVQDHMTKLVIQEGLPFSHFDNPRLTAMIHEVLQPSHSLATSYNAEQNFIQCLITSTQLTSPIAGAIYTPANSSFPTVLQAYIRNLRFNESTTPKPAIIVTAIDLSHVQASITCARKHKLLMKTRSGGHDYEGLSYVADEPFFILDLFNFRSINVSIEDETAWVQTGATLGELYYRIAEKSSTHGFPGGVCPTVCVGGHFSGGGYGNMMRKYGLSVDNIIDAELVDVNGKLLNRESMGEDLFWAITGGGGVSFGVIISYKINLVRVPKKITVFKVTKMSVSNVTNVAHRWLQVADKLKAGLFIRMTVDVVNDTNGEKTMRASFPSLFLGNTTNLINIMDQSFPELGLQRSDCQEMNWTQSVLWYFSSPPGSPDSTLLSRIRRTLVRLKRKSDYVKKPISKKGLRSIFKKMIELEHVRLTFNPYGGRLAEISEFAKPFPHRAGNIAKILYASDWNENGVDAANHYINLTRVLYNHMTPFVSKFPREAFLNYRDLDIGVTHNGQNRFLEGTVYGVKYFKEANFKRLVKVKTMVDPENFFRNEQSVPTLPSSRK